jgi:hypothetical protein
MIMEMKSYLVATLLAITLFSCTKENEVKSVAESQVLNFDSEKAMQNKITEIEAFKKEQEAQIIQKLLQRNNLKAPKEADFLNAQKISTTNLIDQKAVLEDLKFYHTENLKAIDAERAYFGFTSIQSIADEINSLKLINNTKSNELYARFKSFLLKNKYETNIIYNKDISNLINAKGELYLSNKNVAKNYLKKAKLSVASTDKNIKSGFVATGYNNFVIINYSTDIDYSKVSKYVGTRLVFKDNNWVNEDFYIDVPEFEISTTLGCFVLSPSGYVSYPCYFYTNPSSRANFNISCSNLLLNFGSGQGKIIQNRSGSQNYSSLNCPEGVTGLVSGNFAFPVGSTFLWVSGSQTF